MTDTVTHEYNLPSPIAEVAESLLDSPIIVNHHHQHQEEQQFFPPSAPALSPTSHPGGEGLTRSFPNSRRGSQHSMTSGVVAGGYGGLPPPEPLHNPRRSSVTGSYSLPCPPDWLRSHAEDFRRRNNSSKISGSSGRDSPILGLGISERRHKAFTSRGVSNKSNGGTMVHFFPFLLLVHIFFTRQGSFVLFQCFSTLIPMNLCQMCHVYGGRVVSEVEKNRFRWMEKGECSQPKSID